MQRISNPVVFPKAESKQKLITQMQPFIQVGHGNRSSRHLEDWSQPKDVKTTTQRCERDNQKI